MDQAKVLIGAKFVAGIIEQIENAKVSIDIIVYDWRVYPNNDEHPVSKVNAALHSAFLRGVAVRALVNNALLCDQLKKLGIKARHFKSTKILHAKAMIIDHVTAIVGSHNYTKGGMLLNHEVSVIVNLGNEENELQAYFNNLFGL